MTDTPKYCPDPDRCTYSDCPTAFCDRHVANAPCITRIGESNGKAFVIYLRDGTKIVVGRDKTTKGPAWLEVQKQAKIVPLHTNTA